MLVAHFKRGALAFGVAAPLGGPAAAELPPQYTVWSDFAAITAQAEIPGKLGVVDRIERTGTGYRISGGNCWIDATITRKAPTGPQGQPMVGPSRISDIRLGEKTCK